MSASSTARMVEWRRVDSLKLIAIFRQNPCLWQVKNKCYKDRNAKFRAMSIILAEMSKCIEDITLDEIKKKWQSLRSQLRREIRLLAASTKTDEVYEPKLWCFKDLIFLHDEDMPDSSSTLDVSLDPLDEVNEYMKNLNDGVSRDLEHIFIQENEDNSEEQFTNDEDHNENCSAKSNSSQANPPLFNIMRNDSPTLNIAHKRNRIKSPDRIPIQQDPTQNLQITEACSVLRDFIKSNTSTDVKDGCSVYGEHVGFKLRNYDNHTCAIVQHHINNIIFKADMGMYVKQSNGDVNHPGPESLLKSALSQPGISPSPPPSDFIDPLASIKSEVIEEDMLAL